MDEKKLIDEMMVCLFNTRHELPEKICKSMLSVVRKYPHLVAEVCQNCKTPKEMK